METKNNFRNELAKRNEIVYLIESEKNPSFAEMKKLISEELKKPEETIEVYNILSKFGRKTFEIFVYAYDSVEDLEKAKQLTKKQREEIKKAKEEEAKKKEEEEAKAETKEEKPEEKPEEQPKAETKEEKPEEQPKAETKEETKE